VDGVYVLTLAAPGGYRLRASLAGFAEMTVTAAMIGLMPITWSIGTGADVMKRVAAPMVGGLATSFALELLVYRAIYLLWRWHTEVRQAAVAATEATS
jgi:copper/silver efflux system protein